MSGIFISYRREDSAGWAAQLSRRLSDEFGKDQIFMDVITLKPGSDFVAEIQRWLARADSAIVLVGSHWLSLTDITGRRRLDDPKDQVRSEVAAALTLRLSTIPVLVDNAMMPPERELPRNLKAFARLNAFEISPNRADQDLQRLVEHLRATSGIAAAANVRVYHEGKWFLGDADVDCLSRRRQYRNGIS